jgi:hypothetical protein
MMPIFFFYSLFLLLPEIFIRTGLVSILTILIFCFTCLGIPLGYLAFSFPPAGNKFLDSILEPPLTHQELQNALELEGGKWFPNHQSQKSTTSQALAQNYTAKISHGINQEKNIWHFLFPKPNRFIIYFLLMSTALALTIKKIDLVMDVINALRSGLPLELISVRETVKFSSLTARIIPPAYMEDNKSREVNLIENNALNALKGSQVTLSGTVPENIISGRLLLSTDKGLEHYPLQKIMPKESQADKKKAEFNQFTVSFLIQTKGAFALELSAKQGIGKSRVFLIKTIDDSPPKIIVKSPPQHHKIIYGNTIGIEFIAQDDYGIMEINLYHRDPAAGEKYHRELIARFPKEPKRFFQSTHIWNPVLREGKKINELLYTPATQKIEYFLEVRDINNFSKIGTATSDLRYIYFKDKIKEIKQSIDLLREMIRDGKTLMITPDNQRKSLAYLEKLKQFKDYYEKELKNILPKSNIIPETDRTIHSLQSKNPQHIKNTLGKYVPFLESYLTILSYLLESEKREMLLSEIKKASEDIHNNKLAKAMERIKKIAQTMGVDVSKELDNVKQLLRQGKNDEARGALAHTLNQMLQKKSQNSSAQSMAAKELLDKILKEMQGIKDDVTKQLQAQESNLKETREKKISSAHKNQMAINNELSRIQSQLEALSGKFPFMDHTMNAHSQWAKIFGNQAWQMLGQRLQADKMKLARKQKKELLDKGEKSEEQVVMHLRALLNSMKRQEEAMKLMEKGEFESMMPQNSLSQFIFIPKEAVYTIPIDFKNKIIEYSKNRKEWNQMKGSFWKDILE